jgi:hypothetical protein
MLNPPTADPTISVPLVSRSHPQPSGFTTHLAPSENSNLGPSAGLTTSESTDEEDALILRLRNLHVSPADITRVVAIMSGHEESTVEEARLLRRLCNLDVSAEDINLIVGAVQRRRQSNGVARDNTYGEADIGQDTDPPPRYGEIDIEES